LLKLCAYTGTAAFNIKCQTIHALFKFVIGKTIDDFSVKKMETLTELLRNVQFLLIDEISMVSQEILFEIHRLLCKMHNNQLPFGGINIIVLGDFGQLDCVKARPLYDIREAEMLMKENIWATIDKVIVLKEQVRAAECKIHQKLLDDVRTHHVTNQTVEILRSRMIANNLNVDISSQEWLSAPILVTRNDVGDALNIMKLRTIASALNVTEFVISALDTIDGGELTMELQNEIHIAETTGDKYSQFSNSSNKRRRRVLHLCIGARVVITNNVETELGLTNGTYGYVHDIIISNPSSAHSVVENPNKIFLTEPPIVLLRIDKPDSRLKKFKIEELDIHNDDNEDSSVIVPIFPRTSYFKFQYANLQTELVIHRSQLDLDLAYAVTHYKSQGQTIPYAIFDLKYPQTGQLDPNTGYVMLSRSPGYNKYLILRDFNAYKILNTVQSEALLREYARQEEKDLGQYLV
jgi:hypothetical protein